MTDAHEIVDQPLMPKAVSPIPSRAELNLLTEIANSIANSQLPLPPSCSTPQALLLKFLYGRELGLPPMASLYEIDIIEGKGSLNAKTMVGLVRRRQLGDVELLVSNSEEAIVEAWRTDRPDSRIKFRFSIEDAAKADLVHKKNWTKYPEAMLLARVQAKACRALFQEMFLGLAYTAEELGAEVAEEGTVEFIDSTATTGVTRKNEPAKATVEDAVQASEIVQAVSKVAESLATPEPVTAPVPSEQEQMTTYVYEIKHLAGTVLALPMPQWEALKAKWLPADRSMTPQEVAKLHRFLSYVSSIRQFRRGLDITDEDWARVLLKRGVDNEVDLSFSQAETLVDKLGRKLTPFEPVKFPVKQNQMSMLLAEELINTRFGKEDHGNP